MSPLLVINIPRRNWRGQSLRFVRVKNMWTKVINRGGLFKVNDNDNPYQLFLDFPNDQLTAGDERLDTRNTGLWGRRSVFRVTVLHCRAINNDKIFSSWGMNGKLLWDKEREKILKRKRLEMEEESSAVSEGIHVLWHYTHYIVM
jgi:hypothetical protein